MDLSAVIFVALAVAWALYLIPKALSHHDEMARTRSIDKFSDSLRVLGRKKPAPVEPLTAPAATAPPAISVPVTRTPWSRAAARRAATRRRRVLYLLLLAAVALAGTSYAVLTPWWSLGFPSGVILVFLAIARHTVRRERSARRAAPVASAVELAEDRIDVDLEAQVGEAAMPVEDEGSLWDPLPVTLPTYVGKARARRTVRTIELTQMSSSGHDPADSALVARAEAADAEATAATESDDAAAEQRRVAGA